MKKISQKIAALLSTLAMALIAFPSGVYADIAPEPPIPMPSDGPGVALAVIVVLVIAVVAESMIILKKIKKK